MLTNMITGDYEDRTGLDNEDESAGSMARDSVDGVIKRSGKQTCRCNETKLI